MTTATSRASVMLALSFIGVGAGAVDTLYARLGGEQGVAAITGDLIDRVSADPRTASTFADAKLDRIKKLLAEQFCELSDGPCHYSGDPMKQVHAGHHITEAQFYILVTYLRDIMKQRHVDLRSRNELLAKLAPMKRDVVEHHAPQPAPNTQPTVPEVN